MTVHAETFADLFENQCRFRHFQNYLTGLMVLLSKSLADIARCILDTARNDERIRAVIMYGPAVVALVGPPFMTSLFV